MLRGFARAVETDSPDATKQALLGAGFLDYPTAVKAFDEHRLLLVESRRVGLLHATTSEIENRSPRLFMNLSDGAVLDADRVLLLEGGMYDEGRIACWDFRRSEQKTVAERVRAGAGIAVDAGRRYLLLTIGREAPYGRIIRFEIGDQLQLQRESVVLDRLHVPRYLCQVSDGEWCCSTAHGPVRFTC
jgi:hypothetical protein